MNTLVTYPDAELWGTGFLRTALTARLEPYAQNVYVGNAVPTIRRDRMVTIRRDGGSVDLPIPLDMARLGINVWAPTDQEANDLSRLVRSLLHQAEGQAPVAGVTDLSGPSPVPDESQQARRFFTLEVALRGS